MYPQAEQCKNLIINLIDFIKLARRNTQIEKQLIKSPCFGACSQYTRSEDDHHWMTCCLFVRVHKCPH